LNLGIKDKLAVVVGASKGLGREVALDLAREGANVVAIARSKDLLDTMELGAEGACIVADVTDEPHRIATQVIAQFGAPDIVYYAIGGSRDIKDKFSTAEQYALVWYYNLGVAIEMNRAFIPLMVIKGWGRIVLTSTDGVRRHIGHAPYTAAKHALEGYVSIVGRELAGNGIVMTAVVPGPIRKPGQWLYDQPQEWNETFFDDHLPIRRFGDAKEAAKVVTFLCSQQSAFMPGAIVPIDGGSR